MRHFLDLRQVQYFVHVYEQRNFSKAAEKAHVVQPALSMQIRRLEDELATKLFERTSRGVKPTPAGRRLYELYLPIIRDMTQAKQEILDLGKSGEYSGLLRVGLPPSLNRGIIGPCLAEFSDRYPNVEVHLTEAYTGELTAMVANDQLDFALGAVPDLDSQLPHRHVYNDVVMLACGMPVHGPNLTPLDISSIRDLKLICPSNQHRLGTQLLMHIKSQGLPVNHIVQIDGFVASLEFAQASDWCGVFPAISILRDMREKRIFAYPLIAPKLEFELHLVENSKSSMTAVAHRFADILEQAVEDAGMRIRAMLDIAEEPDDEPGAKP
ncbi:LysR family transcriptional regulator [Martelella sp. FLE1502]